jgi:hypothetical protein
MDTASSPATRVFPGLLGTIAANISTMGPIQEIIGETDRVVGCGLQCINSPMENAVRIM